MALASDRQRRERKKVEKLNSRYVFNSDPNEIIEKFKVHLPADMPVLQPRYNIAPTQAVPVIRQNPIYRMGKDVASRDFTHMRWGFIPDWAKTDGPGEMFFKKPIINIRSETVMEKPSFRSAFRRRRCLIPANGFYEWKTEAGLKQPYLAHLAEKGTNDPTALPMFALAAIWETWLGADGTEMDTAAFLTRAAPAGFTLHHRIPLVIGAHHFDRWLHADERDLPQYARLLDEPNPHWQIRRVDRKMGNSRNQGPELVSEIFAKTGNQENNSGMSSIPDLFD